MIISFRKNNAESVERQCQQTRQALQQRMMNNQYISCDKLSTTNSNNTDNNSQQILPVADNYSYVQLTAAHEYNYPLPGSDFYNNYTN